MKFFFFFTDFNAAKPKVIMKPNKRAGQEECLKKSVGVGVAKKVALLGFEPQALWSSSDALKVYFLES